MELKKFFKTARAINIALLRSEPTYGDIAIELEKFTMDIANLGKLLEKYEDKWIAIDESAEKIVGSGDNAFEATENAERKGYQETILFKVPCFDAAVILMAFDSGYTAISKTVPSGSYHPQC